MNAVPCALCSVPCGVCFTAFTGLLALCVIGYGVYAAFTIRKTLVGLRQVANRQQRMQFSRIIRSTTVSIGVSALSLAFGLAVTAACRCMLAA